jgi:hypothetical protein
MYAIIRKLNFFLDEIVVTGRFWGETGHSNLIKKNHSSYDEIRYSPKDEVNNQIGSSG